MQITVKTRSGHIETTVRDLVLAVTSESASRAEADAVLMNMIEEGRVVFRATPSRAPAAGVPAFGA